MTDKATLFPVTEPAPGCRTETCSVPTDVAVLDAFSVVGETYVVVTGEPLMSTCESLAKLAPFSVIVSTPSVAS